MWKKLTLGSLHFNLQCSIYFGLSHQPQYLFRLFILNYSYLLLSFAICYCCSHFVDCWTQNSPHKRQQIKSLHFLRISPLLWNNFCSEQFASYNATCWNHGTWLDPAKPKIFMAWKQSIFFLLTNNYVWVFMAKGMMKPRSLDFVNSHEWQLQLHCT